MSNPFVYGEIVPQERITIDARDDYAWPSARSPNTGAAQLDSVTFLVIPESGVRNGALLSGEIDVDHLVAEQDAVDPDRVGVAGVRAEGVRHHTGHPEPAPLIEAQVADVRGPRAEHYA